MYWSWHNWGGWSEVYSAVLVVAVCSQENLQIWKKVLTLTILNILNNTNKRLENVGSSLPQTKMWDSNFSGYQILNICTDSVLIRGIFFFLSVWHSSSHLRRNLKKFASFKLTCRQAFRTCSWLAVDVQGPSPLWVVPLWKSDPGWCKEADWASTQASSTPPLSPLLEFLLWFYFMTDYKLLFEIKPFLPRLLLFMMFYHSSRGKSMTNLNFIYVYPNPQNKEECLYKKIGGAFLHPSILPSPSCPPSSLISYFLPFTDLG